MRDECTRVLPMESEVAEVPFSGRWESVMAIAGNPRELFSVLPYYCELSESDGKTSVKLVLKRFLLKFEFSGLLELTFSKPYITYIMKGPNGLLVLAFIVDGETLKVRASGDIPGERMLRKKLRMLAIESGKALARFSRSYELVAPLMVGSPTDFVIDRFKPDLLPHILRLIRFKTGLGTFVLKGTGRKDRFFVKVRGEVVETVEQETSSGVSLIEVGQRLLDVAEKDFSGLEASGRYEFRILEGLHHQSQK